MVPKMILLLLIILAASDCRSQPQSQKGAPDDMLVTLKRSGCFGACPDYTLSVSGDGAVTFEGRRYVKVQGMVRGKISPEKIQALIDEFAKADYFHLKDKYETEEDGCPGVLSDASFVVTSIRLKGRTKSVSHYCGCHDGGSVYPKGLTELENRIDAIVGTSQWIQ